MATVRIKINVDEVKCGLEYKGSIALGMYAINCSLSLPRRIDKIECTMDELVKMVRFDAALQNSQQPMQMNQEERRCCIGLFSQTARNLFINMNQIQRAAGLLHFAKRSVEVTKEAKDTNPLVRLLLRS